MLESFSMKRYTKGTYPHPCIYKLTFGKDTYIGQTNNLDVRMMSHRSAMRRGKAPDNMIEAFNRCNGDVLIEVLERLPDKYNRALYDEAEHKYITEYAPNLNKQAAPIYHNDPEAEKKHRSEYYKEYTKTFKQISLRPSNEEAQRMIDFADAHDMTLQQFIKTAIQEYMDRHTDAKPFWEED